MGLVDIVILIALQAPASPARMPIPIPIPMQGAMPVAAGTGWVLEQAGSTLRLVERDRVATATIARRRQTPWGTAIEARGADGGVVTLATVFAACRAGGRRASHAVRLSWAGRRLQGCQFRPPPLEKPLLD